MEPRANDTGEDRRSEKASETVQDEDLNDGSQPVHHRFGNIARGSVSGTSRAPDSDVSYPTPVGQLSDGPGANSEGPSVQEYTEPPPAVPPLTFDDDNLLGVFDYDEDDLPDEAVTEDPNQEADDDFEGLEHRQHLADRAYKQGTQYVSVDLLLSAIGMEQYTSDFIEADEDMIELFARVEDEEVDQVLRNIERKSRFEFPYADRCKIWKALRYRWFRAPENAQSYIHRAEVPLLTVPKKDRRFVRDSHIDMNLLESDRQKSVVRRAEFDEIDGTTMVQEEVYKREPHLWYELNGLEKTIQFWLNQDPRKMSREDPREEVLLNWIKEIELECAKIIDKFKLIAKIKRQVQIVFFVIRAIFALLALLFVSIAFVDISTTESHIPALERLLSASYLNCSVLYLSTYLFITEITRDRKRRTSNLDRSRKMHSQCRLLYTEMISFRLKTHYLRQVKINRYLDESRMNASQSRSAVYGNSGIYASPKTRRAAVRGTHIPSELLLLRDEPHN
jgi:hypothetical protein